MAEPGPSRQRQADLALIRAARPGEAGALTALALAAKAHWGYPASFMARCRAALTIEPAMIRRHVFRLAESDGGIILGFYGFEPDPAGIGRALWEDAVALARRKGYGRMTIVGDPHAAGFYRRMGAVPAGAAPSEIDPARALPLFRLELG